MAGTGRNDPCPCGSGRKYKQCCLRRDEAEAAGRRHRDQGAEVALDWLTARYPKEYEAAVVDGYFAALGEDERDVIAQLGADARSMIDQNIGEWLLADGTLALEREGERTEPRVADLVLAPDGPALDADQRALLEALRDRPLRLYEVVATVPGSALTLRDALEPATPLEVAEPRLSTLFEPGEFLGLRLLETAAGPEPSGALYGFSASAGADVLGRLREELESFAADTAADEAWLRRQVVSETVIDCWLAGLTAVEEDPEHAPHA